MPSGGVHTIKVGCSTKALRRLIPATRCRTAAETGAAVVPKPRCRLIEVSKHTVTIQDDLGRVCTQSKAETESELIYLVNASRSELGCPSALLNSRPHRPEEVLFLKRGQCCLHQSSFQGLGFVRYEACP